MPWIWSGKELYAEETLTLTTGTHWLAPAAFCSDREAPGGRRTQQTASPDPRKFCVPTQSQRYSKPAVSNPTSDALRDRRKHDRIGGPRRTRPAHVHHSCPYPRGPRTLSRRTPRHQPDGQLSGKSNRLRPIYGLGFFSCYEVKIVMCCRTMNLAPQLSGPLVRELAERRCCISTLRIWEIHTVEKLRALGKDVTPGVLCSHPLTRSLFESRNYR